MVNVEEVDVTVTGTFLVVVAGRRVTFDVTLTVVFVEGFLVTGFVVLTGFCVVLFAVTLTGFVVVRRGGIEEVGFCVEFVTFDIGFLVALLLLVEDTGLDGAFVVGFREAVLFDVVEGAGRAVVRFTIIVVSGNIVVSGEGNLVLLTDS